MPKLPIRMTQSLRTVSSPKSTSFLSSGLEKVNLSLNDPIKFEEMVAAGCKKYLNNEYQVEVQLDYRTDKFLNSLKRGNPVKLKQMQSSGRIADPSIITRNNMSTLYLPQEPENKAIIDETIVVVTAVYESSDKLCEILLFKQKYVPRKLVQIIGLVAPYFPICTKISFKDCGINGYTIHELTKFLHLTSITEVCLDDSPLCESSFSLLLETPCRLTSFSLCRCKIDDDGCVEIASKLHFLQPAEETLSALNLSSNHITDVGAKSIGEALRSNRHLRYLNLADNWIGDDGADRILRALIDFPLTYDEIVSKRRRYYEFLRAKRHLQREHACDLDTKSMVTLYSCKSFKKKGLKYKRKSKPNPADDITLRFRSENTANESIGQFDDPFMSSFTKSVDGYTYCCPGNMVLCYLNLSYNDLSYGSVKKIREVLLQQNVNKTSGQVGLLRVVVDGNPVPVSCDDLDDIGNMLQRDVLRLAPRTRGIYARRNTRISVISEKKV